MPTPPVRTTPPDDWPHLALWQRVNALFYALPNYFETQLVVKGINVTDIFSLGGAFATVIETQVVTILNGLRNLWDASNEYANYVFVRQAQTFPDVLLRHVQHEREILFGIELKSWYVLSKEGEPSFRFQATPEACAPPDLLVVVPWLLSEVISGTPRLLTPYKESAFYAAQYRNYYWQESRQARGENPLVRPPAVEKRRYYPASKQEASDEAVADKGGNFGRIARAGILDEYIGNLKQQDYLGIKIAHWISFFKAIAETSTEAQIEQKIRRLKVQMQISHANEAQTAYHNHLLEILEHLEMLWRKS